MTHEELAQKIQAVRDELMTAINAHDLRLSTLDHQQNRIAESFNRRLTLLEQDEHETKAAIARMEGTLNKIYVSTTDLRDLMKVWARHGDDGK